MPKPTTKAQRKAAAERQARHREKKRLAREEALNASLRAAGIEPPAAVEGATGDDLHPAGIDGAETTAAPGNEAAAAVAGGKAKKKDRRQRELRADDTPYQRAAGWLRIGAPEGAGLSTSQLRDLARRVMEVDFLPFLQELIADPKAKDVDRLRAGDIVAKLSVGYITPDLMNADDAPELPAPIFTTTEGELPGDTAPPAYDDGEQTEAPVGAGAAEAGGAA